MARYRPTPRAFAVLVALVLVLAGLFAAVDRFGTGSDPTPNTALPSERAPGDAASTADASDAASTAEVPGGAASSADAPGESAPFLVDTPLGRVPSALAVPVPPDRAARLDGVRPPGPGFDTSALHSRTAILVDATTGAVLAAKDADLPLPPASLTKLMTLDLAFDDVEAGRHALDEEVPVSVEAWHTGGSSMFLDPSLHPTFEELLYGIAVDSGNDAAVAMAEDLAGSVPAFVDRMNDHAAELGMAHTRFVNPTGLPAPGHESTASDLARLARHYLALHPEALVIHRTREYTFKGITQWNQNPLLIHDYPGADGLKTGFASNCFNLVGTARRGDTRLLVVTLCAASEKERDEDAEALLDWGFAHYRTEVVALGGEPLGEAAVEGGAADRVALVAAEPLAATVPADAPKAPRASLSGTLPETADLVALRVTRPLRAPLAKGQVVGMAEVRVGGEVLASAPVTVAVGVVALGPVGRMRAAHPNLVWAVASASALAGLTALLWWDAQRRRRRMRRWLARLTRTGWGGDR